MRGSGQSGNDCLVDWELQGRTGAESGGDGKWVTLRSHVGDRALFNVSRSAEPFQWVTWVVEGCLFEVDAVRIAMTGVNTNRNASLVMVGLEVYGCLSDPNMLCRDGF